MSMCRRQLVVQPGVDGYAYYEILEQEGARFLAAGCYHDQYRKIDGQWKFQSRTIHMATDFDRAPEK